MKTLNAGIFFVRLQKFRSAFRHSFFWRGATLAADIAVTAKTVRRCLHCFFFGGGGGSTEKLMLLFSCFCCVFVFENESYTKYLAEGFSSRSYTGFGFRTDDIVLVFRRDAQTC